MTGRPIDPTTWPRAEHFKYFRKFDHPHFATTVRVDVTRLMTIGKPLGFSPFRHTVWAIGTGLTAVPALCVRFKGETILQFGAPVLSSTVALKNGEYGYGYYPFIADRAMFDAECARITAQVQDSNGINAGETMRLNVAYLSCLPWVDFTALDHALPQSDDCIPRISWGKIVPTVDGYDMAMTVQINHALADGLHVSQFFEATQTALDMI